MVVVDLDDPLQPKVLAKIALNNPRGLDLQFRYLFAVDDDGLKVIDVTLPENPRVVSGSLVPMQDAKRITVSRTYAYLADGENGLKIIQLTSPELNPKFYGISPQPNPKLVAWRKTADPALSISRPLERDRAVDEMGNQIAVLGRLGSRPFNLEEMRRLYLTQEGRVWTVRDSYWDSTGAHVGTHVGTRPGIRKRAARFEAHFRDGSARARPGDDRRAGGACPCA